MKDFKGKVAFALKKHLTRIRSLFVIRIVAGAIAIEASQENACLCQSACQKRTVLDDLFIFVILSVNWNWKTGVSHIQCDHTAVQEKEKMIVENVSPIVRIFTRFRDSRLVWDVMGSLYNQRIYNAISELYNHIARLSTPAGKVHMLDVGTGRGYISLQLATWNPRAMITGIDYSFMQVRKAEKLRQKRKIANCSFSRGNAMNIAFQEDLFDAAVSIGSIKHWPDGVRGLKEINRVLKPGGRLMISETDREASNDDIRNFIKRFKIWFIPDRLLFWGLRHVIFGQSYSEKTLADMVRQAGFRDVECQKIAQCPYIIVKARK